MGNGGSKEVKQLGEQLKAERARHAATQEKLRLASSATEGSQQAADAAAVHVGVLQAGLAAAEQQKAAADARVLQLQQELEQERLRNAELSRQLEGTPTPDPETPRTSQPGQVPPTPPTDYLPPLPDSDSDDGSDEEGPPPPEGLAADSFGVLPPFGGMTGGNNSWTQFKHQSRQMAAGLYRLLHNHTADQPLQMNKLWVLQGALWCAVKAYCAMGLDAEQRRAAEQGRGIMSDADAAAIKGVLEKWEQLKKGVEARKGARTVADIEPEGASPHVDKLMRSMADLKMRATRWREEQKEQAAEKEKCTSLETQAAGTAGMSPADQDTLAKQLGAQVTAMEEEVASHDASLSALGGMLSGLRNSLRIRRERQGELQVQYRSARDAGRIQQAMQLWDELLDVAGSVRQLQADLDVQAADEGAEKTERAAAVQRLASLRAALAGMVSAAAASAASATPAPAAAAQQQQHEARQADLRLAQLVLRNMANRGVVSQARIERLRAQVEELRRQYNQHQADIMRRRDIPAPGNAIRDTIANLGEVGDLQVASNGLQLSMAALEASLAREYEALNNTTQDQQRLEAQIAALQAQDGEAQP